MTILVHIQLQARIHLLACLSKKPPHSKDIATGDHAAKKGISVPFTPKALKKKLRA